ncbi:MAG TPA: AAA family ATPase [archaeon]|nr:AAA family ATPase [archaeon]
MAAKNIFSRASAEKSVFLDERLLYPEFVPERLPHREKHIEALAYCFEPLLKGRKPFNLFIAGPTGVGKTVCAKYVLRQLEEYSDRAKSIYLNCFEFNSRSSVLSSIANFVGAALPRRGLAVDEIFSKLLESLKKCGFTPIVVLDEVDQLLLSENSQKILYDLLRVVEYEKQRIGIAMISNEAALTARLDPRVRSSMAEQTILFEPYTPQQLKGILAERAELAFVKGALEKDVLNVAAAHAAKLGGDARIALESLLKAGRLAEKENSGTVSLKHLEQAFSSVDSASLLKGFKHLGKDEKALLKIIAENPSIHAGKIYEFYRSSDSGELKERRLRDVLIKLEKQNFISFEYVSLGNKGKTKIFSSRIPKEFLIKELAKEGA